MTSVPVLVIFMIVIMIERKSLRCRWCRSHRHGNTTISEAGVTSKPSIQKAVPPILNWSGQEVGVVWVWSYSCCDNIVCNYVLVWELILDKYLHTTLIMK